MKGLHQVLPNQRVKMNTICIKMKTQTPEDKSLDPFKHFGNINPVPTLYPYDGRPPSNVRNEIIALRF